MSGSGAASQKDRAPERPRLLVVSSVRPFPGAAGQEQRVRNKLLAFREHFTVTFLTHVRREERGEVAARLGELADEALLLDSLYWQSPLFRLLHRGAAAAYAAVTGLKVSNYVVGRLELSPRRVLAAVGSRRFDAALFEYWHVWRAADELGRHGVATVLDMHDVLWRSYEEQMSRALPRWLREARVAAYRSREEAAWRRFGALVTINREEDAYVRSRLPEGFPLFYAPMGIDLAGWPYRPQPADPPRLAYYGSFKTRRNQEAALRVVEAVMPRIWRERPEVELWLVGSSPSPELRELGARDSRLHVPGFVDDVGALLATMCAVLCPFSGAFGFRSRLVEVMATGVPVVASSDAVAGMELRHGHGLLLAEDDAAMACHSLELLGRRALAGEQGRSARREAEERYSFEATYGRLSRELAGWVRR